MKFPRLHDHSTSLTIFSVLPQLPLLRLSFAFDNTENTDTNPRYGRNWNSASRSRHSPEPQVFDHDCLKHALSILPLISSLENFSFVAFSSKLDPPSLLSKRTFARPTGIRALEVGDRWETTINTSKILFTWCSHPLQNRSVPLPNLSICPLLRFRRWCLRITTFKVPLASDLLRFRIRHTFASSKTRCNCFHQLPTPLFNTVFCFP